MTGAIDAGLAINVGGVVAAIAVAFTAVRIGTRQNTESIQGIRGEFEAVKRTVDRLNQAMVGLNGDNGALGDVRLVRERTHVHATMLTRHSFQIHELARHVKVQLADPEDITP